MRRPWGYAVLLLIPMALYTLGLAHGRPRPAYSPSTLQNAWLHPVTVYHPDEFAYVGLAETILDGETGFLVPPEDPAALADRVVRLLRDPALRAQMGQAGRRHVLANFTADRFAARFAQLIDDLV